MITYSRLGKKGNIGNQLFQIASTIGLAKKYHHNYIFPIWEYEDYFDYNFFHGKIENFERITEKHFHYYNWNLEEGNYDLFGYLQSEKYFDIVFTKKIFTFKEKFLTSLKEKNSLTENAQNILISVRRGDFVHHPWFYQLSYKYYLGAIIENFPDWKERNLVFSSDDISYCKYHFSFLPNSVFLTNLTPIEQLAFASQCNDFIISNSTFSWWMAWLGEKKGSKIIRPLKNFRGKHGLCTNENDYFPERWNIFNHHKYRLPLKYYKLILKGEYFNFFNLIKYYFSKVKEKVKIFLLVFL